MSTDKGKGSGGKLSTTIIPEPDVTELALLHQDLEYLGMDESVIRKALLDKGWKTIDKLLLISFELGGSYKNPKKLEKRDPKIAKFLDEHNVKKDGSTRDSVTLARVRTVFKGRYALIVALYAKFVSEDLVDIVKKDPVLYYTLWKNGFSNLSGDGFEKCCKDQAELYKQSSDVAKKTQDIISSTYTSNHILVENIEKLKIVNPKWFA